jgi:hypothetical protein
MLIRIWIDRTQPLSGTAEGKEAGPLAFDGWLELLGAIAELLGPTSERPRRTGPCGSG